MANLGFVDDLTRALISQLQIEDQIEETKLEFRLLASPSSSSSSSTSLESLVRRVNSTTAAPATGIEAANTGTASDAEIALRLHNEEIELQATDLGGLLPLGRGFSSFSSSDSSRIPDKALEPLSPAVPSSTTTPTAPLARQTEEQESCIICTDSFPPEEVIKTRCSHTYCRSCLTLLFENAIRDESSYPPRCCIPITISTAAPMLSKDLTTRFLARETEMNTPASSRVYCYDSACGAFIAPPHFQGKVAVCLKCERFTCVRCKSGAHFDECVVGRDQVGDEVRRIAEEKGWKVCYNCNGLVELSGDCNHVTCRCGAQFCYACGLKWKTCSCDQWTEERLAERVREMLERGGGGGGNVWDDEWLWPFLDGFLQPVDRGIRGQVPRNDVPEPVWGNGGQGIVRQPLRTPPLQQIQPPRPAQPEVVVRPRDPAPLPRQTPLNTIPQPANPTRPNNTSTPRPSSSSPQTVQKSKDPGLGNQLPKPPVSQARPPEIPTSGPLPRTVQVPFSWAPHSTNDPIPGSLPTTPSRSSSSNNQIPRVLETEQHEPQERSPAIPGPAPKSVSKAKAGREIENKDGEETPAMIRARMLEAAEQRRLASLTTTTSVSNEEGTDTLATARQKAIEVAERRRLAFLAGKAAIEKAEREEKGSAKSAVRNSGRDFVAGAGSGVHQVYRDQTFKERKE